MTNPTSIEQAVLEQLSLGFTKIPFNHMLGLKIKTIDKEKVTLTFIMNDHLVGNFLHGILHGGVISSVIDMAGGMIVMANAIKKHSHLDPSELMQIVGKTSTIDLQVSYLRPGIGEHFTATAWLVKSGSKISFTRMELSNHKDTLIATGTGTYACDLSKSQSD